MKLRTNVVYFDFESWWSTIIRVFWCFRLSTYSPQADKLTSQDRLLNLEWRFIGMSIRTSGSGCIPETWLALSSVWTANRQVNSPQSSSLFWHLALTPKTPNALRLTLTYLFGSCARVVLKPKKWWVLTITRSRSRWNPDLDWLLVGKRTLTQLPWVSWSSDTNTRFTRDPGDGPSDCTVSHTAKNIPPKIDLHQHSSPFDVLSTSWHSCESTRDALQPGRMKWARVGVQ